MTPYMKFADRMGIISIAFAAFFAAVCPTANTFAGLRWLQKESAHFTIIYREPQAYLAPRILAAAENSLAKLAGIFRFMPSEKITLATFDFADYGTAGATTVPQNFIRLEIEPFELGYEHIPYHDRIQWLMDHELVHIFVNDQASSTESAARSIFSRVMPVQEQPLSVGYSLLTNHSRFTPRWHQEGIASFLETWLTGGYGRALGNFDEMFFRSLVYESRELATPRRMESLAQESFLWGTLYYSYGTRFVTWLATVFGVDQILDWYRVEPGELYEGYEKKFKNTFGLALDEAWERFIVSEKAFQQDNLRSLATAPQTPLRPVLDRSLGWVSQPYLAQGGKKVIFGQHQPHKLTAIQFLDLISGETRTLGSLPSPSIIQIASTAYDPELDLFFYTTNNNQLFRDVHVLDLTTGKSKLLFEDIRVGQLTVAPATHELWGIGHSHGKASLVYSPYPYDKFVPVIEFEFGDELQHLAVSPSGDLLAGTLHQSSGRQAIVVADLQVLKKQGRFLYLTISEEGSPEFPSWSPDEQYLYWNAFTNGVSNLYRVRHGSSGVEALSHTLRGLFRPLFLTADSLFAFEFTSEGFKPVVLPNSPAAKLPAIAYFGQKVVERNPQVMSWSEAPATIPTIAPAGETAENAYSSLQQLKLQALLPVLSGFQAHRVIGLHGRMSDPLNTHDLTFEFGVSPFSNSAAELKTHFRAAYDYRGKYRIELEHNASNFYDLFNAHKSGMMGTKLALGHTSYLKYDNPHKIQRNTTLSLYHGVKAINDNSVPVANPDFVELKSSLSSRNVRRTIGSVDSEFGNEWALTIRALGMSSRQPQLAAGLHAERSQFLTWLRPHNVLHLKIAGGYFQTNNESAMGRFYFGGFGNQLVENREVKQYRNTFRFPGIPGYALSSRPFAKLMLENNLPPLRFSNFGLGQHFLSHIDASVFTQGLLADSPQSLVWLNLGAQVNLVFTHWFNLESTFSAGAAQAWHQFGSSREWFVSFKLLKN